MGGEMNDAWDEWLDPELARTRFLAELYREAESSTKRMEYAIQHWNGSSHMPAIDRWIAEQDRIDKSREWGKSKGWFPSTPERPGRRMPKLYDIAYYWYNERPGTFRVSLTVPLCFRCLRRLPPEELRPRNIHKRWLSASSYLERAHLVDRFVGGLDGPQNLVPLCPECHRCMPTFEIDQGDRAIAWVQAGLHCSLHPSYRRRKMVEHTHRETPEDKVRIGDQVAVTFVGHDNAGRAIFRAEDGRMFVRVDAYVTDDETPE
jgi:hypothetical protein